MKRKSLGFFIIKYSILGRVTTIRDYGSLIFYDLRGDGQKIQIVCKEDFQKGDENFRDFHDRIRRGDIIGVGGFPGRTKTGELSITAENIKLLSPCLHMLPTQQTGLKDPEVRFRQRYLDLIMNGRVRDIFLKRTKVVQYVRKYLDGLNFLEVRINYTFKKLIDHKN